MEVKLTADERRVITSLKRLGKRWPSTLWLFSNGHTLYVMRTGPRGEHMVTREGGFDPNYIVDRLDIPNDGGDF